MKRAAYAVWILLMLVAAIPSLAQKLPPASRTVFKCEQDGRVVYSDDPCLGAKRFEVQPTRGLDKLSGSPRVGVDVWNERLNEGMAEALRPILGESAEQRAMRHRRAALTPGDRRRCHELDRLIPASEEAEAKAPKEELSSAQERLFLLRERYRGLGC